MRVATTPVSTSRHRAASSARRSPVARFAPCETRRSAGPTPPRQATANPAAVSVDDDYSAKSPVGVGALAGHLVRVSSSGACLTVLPLPASSHAPLPKAHSLRAGASNSDNALRGVLGRVSGIGPYDYGCELVGGTN